MKALSIDLRQRVADALAASGEDRQTQTSVAQRFAVSLSSVERIARKQRESQSLLPGSSTGRRPKVDAERQAAFAQLAASRTDWADWTLHTLADAWQERGGKALSLATTLRTLRRLGCSFKKSAASPRSGTKPNGRPSARR